MTAFAPHPTARPLAARALGQRAHAGLWSAALALLCSGCASLSPPPPVDILPTTPPPIATLPRSVGPATGSLFHNASYRPAFEDRRARMVGDSVTVQIVENITAKQSSTSTIDRESGIEAGIAALPFLNNTVLANKTRVGASSTNNFSGKGGTESANAFTGSITATVIEVLPNGHLVVAGEKQIGVNHNVDVLRFSGTVDPRSLQPGSIVVSTQMANVRIESRGRGAQAEVQAMGWLGRFFNSVAPF